MFGFLAFICIFGGIIGQWNGVAAGDAQTFVLAGVGFAVLQLCLNIDEKD